MASEEKQNSVTLCTSDINLFLYDDDDDDAEY